MISYTCWSHRHKYLNIIELFLNQTISSEEFFKQYVDLHQYNILLAKQLEFEKFDLIVLDKYLEFEKIISSLTIAIEVEISLKSINDKDLSFIPSEDFLKIYIKDEFLKKIRYYC